MHVTTFNVSASLRSDLAVREPRGNTLRQSLIIAARHRWNDRRMT